MINPNTLLSEEEIAILRDSKDWRNYLAIFSIWAQIALGFLIFSFSFAHEAKRKKIINDNKIFTYIFFF